MRAVGTASVLWGQESAPGRKPESSTLAACRAWAYLFGRMSQRSSLRHGKHQPQRVRKLHSHHNGFLARPSFEGARHDIDGRSSVHYGSSTALIGVDQR
jgi:hypothetical protein